MKRFLKIFAISTFLFFAANFAWWFKNYPGNFYSAGNIEVTLMREVPIGTSKAGVVSWLKRKGFTVYHDRNNILGRRDNIHNDFLVTTDLVMTFSFNEKKLLRSFSTQEFYTCL